MNFAEQLEAKANLKVIEFAKEFAETIKPTLIESAEKGYSGYRYTIDTNDSSEKEKMHLYANPLFIEQLNKNLDGVKVEYEEEYIENIIFSGRGWYKHHIVFRW